MLAFEVLEIKFDFSHLAVNVTIGNDGLGALDIALLIVYSIEQDGQLSLLSDVVEALFPLRVERASAFRGDTQVEFIYAFGSLSQIIRHAGVLRAEYGDAAHLTEDRSQGPEEPLLFHQEVASHASCPDVELSYQEVPVAGVWCQTDDILVGVLLRYIGCPPHVFI